MSGMLLSRRTLLAATGVMLTGAGTPPDPFVYLLPAPKEAIVFAPFLLAEFDGHFAREGLAVRFEQVAGGGAKVGEALAAGRGDAGGALGDTPLILRAKDIDVQGVALLGRHSFLTLIHMRTLVLDASSLRGKALGVPSFQDVSYYALKAFLQQHGLTPGDVTVRAAPPAELIDALGKGELHAIVGTVDWGVKAERGGVSLCYRPLDPYYPALAQAIMASDAHIARRPEAIRRFVRAVLAAMDDIVRDPDGAASRYLQRTSQADFDIDEVKRVFRLLATHVYGARAGRFDPQVMARAAVATAQEGLVPAGIDARPSYTNQFIPR